MRVLLLSLLMILMLSAIVYAEDEGSVCEPNDWPVIELSDGSTAEVLINYSPWGSSVDVMYLDYTTQIFLGDYSEPAQFYIHDSDSRRDWGQGVISMSGRSVSDRIVDLSFMPPEYLSVWENLRFLCGELNDSNEFWELVDSASDEDGWVSKLEDGLILMRDGSYNPHSESTRFEISFSINHGDFSQTDPGRLYKLRGEKFISIMTASPYNDPEPEIVLKVMGAGYGDIWTINFKPDEQICELAQSEPYLKMYPVDNDGWVQIIGEILDQLNLFRRHIPDLAEDGLIIYDDDLLLLINQAIEGLTTYEQVVVQLDED